MVNMTFGKACLTSRLTCRTRSAVLLLALATGVVHQDASAQEGRRPADTIPTLGLDQGMQSMDAGAMRLDLVRASQTVAALRPEGWQQFDGIPRSDDASEFDFIRAWYSRLGEKTVSAEDISSEVCEGQLPNVNTKDGSAAVSTEKFLKTLVNGAVVMNDDHTIVDVVDLPDGTYRTVARRDRADTLIRQTE